MEDAPLSPAQSLGDSPTSGAPGSPVPAGGDIAPKGTLACGEDTIDLDVLEQMVDVGEASSSRVAGTHSQPLPGLPDRLHEVMANAAVDDDDAESSDSDGGEASRERERERQTEPTVVVIVMNRLSTDRASNHQR